MFDLLIKQGKAMQKGIKREVQFFQFSGLLGN